MDGPKVPPLTTRILVRSQQVSRLHRRVLAQAYQQVCPEIRLSLPDNKVPDAPRAKPDAADISRLGGRSVVHVAG